MLSFGVPMRAVKMKMWYDGYTGEELDDYQYRRVVFNSKSEKPPGWTEVWEGQYAKVSTPGRRQNTVDSNAKNKDGFDRPVA